jgi:uncharacterized protein (DUF1501 family)
VGTGAREDQAEVLGSASVAPPDAVASGDESGGDALSASSSPEQALIATANRISVGSSALDITRPDDVKAAGRRGTFALYGP